MVSKILLLIHTFYLAISSHFKSHFIATRFMEQNYYIILKAIISRGANILEIFI